MITLEVPPLAIAIAVLMRIDTTRRLPTTNVVPITPAIDRVLTARYPPVPTPTTVLIVPTGTNHRVLSNIEGVASYRYYLVVVSILEYFPLGFNL